MFFYHLKPSVIISLLIILILRIQETIQEELPSNNDTATSAVLSNIEEESPGSETHAKRWVSLTSTDITNQESKGIRGGSAKHRRRQQKKALLQKQLKSSSQSEHSDEANNNINIDHLNELFSPQNSRMQSDESSGNAKQLDSSHEQSSLLVRLEYQRGSLPEANIPILNSDEVKNVPNFVFNGPDHKLVRLFSKEDEKGEQKDEKSSSEKVMDKHLSLSDSSDDDGKKTDSGSEQDHTAKDDKGSGEHTDNDHGSSETQPDPHSASISDQKNDKSSSESKESTGRKEGTSSEKMPPIEVVLDHGNGNYETIPADESVLKLVSPRPSTRKPESDNKRRNNKGEDKKVEISSETQQSVSSSPSNANTCPHPGHMWNRTKNTWNEFKNARTWHQGFSVLRDSASNAMHSVVSCTKSLWSGLTSFFGFGSDDDTNDNSSTKRSASTQTNPSETPELKRKRRSLSDYWKKLKHSFQSSKEGESSVEERDETSEQEQEEEDLGGEVSVIHVTLNEKVAGTAKHALTEFGSGMKRLLTKGYAAISGVGSQMFSSSEHEGQDYEVTSDQTYDDLIEETTTAKPEETTQKKVTKKPPAKNYFEKIGASVYKFFGRRR